MSDEEKKEISVNIKEIKKGFEKTKKFFMRKDVQITLTALIFLLILISSVSIRVSNLGNLIDGTTGDYTAADPDALYFLRLSHVVLEQGNLAGIDEFRAPGLDIVYLKEIMPYTIVGMYKITKIFSPEINFNLIAIISPSIFFAFGLIAFFFLCLLLTRSKVISLISSAFLAFSPAYLFRTMSGVLDHDAIGMLGLFLTLLVFTFGLKKNHKSWKANILWGGLLGLAMAFAFGAWAGSITFIFMIIPFSILIHYLFNLEDKKDKKQKLISFNLIWLIAYILFSKTIGFGFSDILSRLSSPASMLVPFVIGFMIVDYILERNIKKIKFFKENKRAIYSFIITAIIGILFLIVAGKDISAMLSSIYSRMLDPFGGIGRLGSTVSENAQPYLSNWIDQMGKSVFIIFYAGMVFMGIEFSKKAKKQKQKIYLSIFWILLIFSILFSRISSESIFNGTNFVSQLFYLAGLLIFIFYLGHLYFKNRFNISTDKIIIFSWMLFMLILGRAAARTIFVAMPFVCFSIGYFIVNMGKNLRKTKEDILKLVIWIVFIISLIIAFVSLFGNPLSEFSGNYKQVVYTAANIGPVANYQWQSAMKWVRENTNENDIFVHWWDYGYLIQTVGERKSVSDGGHAAGDSGDHNVGRYILTTPNPETALSYMKTWNVSYLVIDPTDYGKYGAYSKIGSDENYDRFSNPSLMVQDESQTIETSTGMKILYQGSNFVDEDIIYGDIFLPGPSFDKSGNAVANSYVIGIIIEFFEADSGLKIQQPEVAYYYNGQQHRIPIRYVYYNDQIIDFGTGVESTFYIIEKLSIDSSGQIDINNIGAGMYLSPKVSKGLFGKLYLMNDPFNEYPTINLANSQDDYFVAALRSQGYPVGEFIYYNGLRGPLKIWEVKYSNDVETHEELLEKTSNWEGALDILFE